MWFRGVNRVFETAIKVSVILAALAAVNLLDRKPVLIATPICNSHVDVRRVESAYDEVGRKAPAWVKAAERQINAGSPVTKILIGSFGQSGSACAAPVVEPVLNYSPLFDTASAAFGSNSTSFNPTWDQKGISAAVASALKKGGWDIYSPKSLPAFKTSTTISKFLNSKQAAQFDGVFAKQLSKNFLSVKTSPAVSFAQDAVTNASTITATVTVSNRGGGAASNVRVEPPPAYAPLEGSTSTFSLAPGERHTLRFAASGGALSGAGSRAFQAFGDPERTVKGWILWVVGLGLGLIALLAWGADATGIGKRGSSGVSGLSSSDRP